MPIKSLLATDDGAVVAGLLRQLAGAFKDRNRRPVVAPDDLVEAADPEQRFALAAHVGEAAVQFRRALEEGELARIRCCLLGVLVPLPEESRVHDPAAGQGKIGLDPETSYSSRELTRPWIRP